MKLGEVVLQLHQVLLHSDEKNNSFISNTFNRCAVHPLEAGELGLIVLRCVALLDQSPMKKVRSAIFVCFFV